MDGARCGGVHPIGLDAHLGWTPILPPLRINVRIIADGKLASTPGTYRSFVRWKQRFLLRVVGKGVRSNLTDGLLQAAVRWSCQAAKSRLDGLEVAEQPIQLCSHNRGEPPIFRAREIPHQKSV